MKIAFIEDGAELGLQQALANKKDTLHVISKGASKHNSGTHTGLPINTDLFFAPTAKAVLSKLDEIKPDVVVKANHFPVFKSAYPLIGSTPFTASLELDRLKAIEFIRQHKIPIKIPRTTTDFDEALKFPTDKIIVKLQNNKYFKVNTKTMAMYKHDLIHWKDNKELKGAIYQQFVEGDEIACGGYYNNRFLRPYTFIQEYKRLHHKGVNNLLMTGESGSCGAFLNKLPPEFQRIMDAHEPLIKGHVGFFDLNTIVDKKGDIYFLEYTTRIGFPTEYEIIGCLDQSYPSFIRNQLEGRDYQVKYPFFAATKIVDAVEVPYLVSVPKLEKGQAIVNVSCEQVSKTKYKSLNLSPDLLVVQGMGDTMKSAIKQMRQVLDGTQGMGIYYLTGVGDNWVHSWK